MSTDQSAQGVSTESVLKTADLLPVFAIAGLGKGVVADACDMLRTLVSERDALASRVRELEVSARRYEWLRAQVWPDNTLAVVLRPKDNTKLGCFLPSGKLLDDAIDHMSAALTTTSGDSHE